jgi:hypothetical protein
LSRGLREFSDGLPEERSSASALTLLGGRRDRLEAGAMCGGPSLALSVHGSSICPVGMHQFSVRGRVLDERL